MVPPDSPMIRFPCHCGHRFELPADMAASSIQCPRCGLLNDVPTFSDLKNWSDDGTVLLKEDEPPARRPRRDPTVYTSFRRAHIDRTGEDVDLRNTYDDLANVGADADPDTIPLLSDERKVAPAKPKYDPVTGELIRPMNLAQSPDLVPADQIPVARSAHSLAYASGDTRDTMTARRIFVQLLMPVNFIVHLFIFGFHVFFHIATLVLFVMLALAGLPPFLAQAPLAFILFGHYVNTLVDNGPEARDELPRPLGNLSIGEDLWRPFVHMTMAFIDAFLPTILCLMFLPPRLLPATILPLGLGFFFFPAILLTVATSGSAANLRPDRLAGVIRAAGGDYVVSFLIFLFALPTFAFALGGVWIIPLELRQEYEWLYVLNHPLVTFPVIFLNIFLMHWGAWHLGVIYRRHYAAFPWVLQRHISTRQRTEAQQAARVRALNRQRQRQQARGPRA